MHSIKNISERNKIDSQSRADTYIRRKRLISEGAGSGLKIRNQLVFNIIL
jgi:hypothetical protein